MDNNNLQGETVIDECRRLHNVLNFQDFMMEGKKGKQETKRSRPIKSRKEFIEDNEDDTIDPNATPERFIKLREQFVKDELQ